MKSNVKKEDVLRYISKKLNDNFAGLKLIIGSSLPEEENYLYHALEYNNELGIANGTFNPETYKLVKQNFIPVSVMSSSGDFNISRPVNEYNKKINISSWDISLSFILPIQIGKEKDGKKVAISNLIQDAISQFRDVMNGGTDFIAVMERDYSTDELPKKEYYTLTSKCSDLNPGMVMILNGNDYIEMILTVSLEIVKDIVLGSQFEYFISYTRQQWSDSNEEYWNEYGVPNSEYDLKQLDLKEPNPNELPKSTEENNGTAGRIEYNKTYVFYETWQQTTNSYYNSLPEANRRTTNQDSLSTPNVNLLPSTTFENEEICYRIRYNEREIETYGWRTTSDTGWSIDLGTFDSILDANIYLEQNYNPQSYKNQVAVAYINDLVDNAYFKSIVVSTSYNYDYGFYRNVERVETSKSYYVSESYTYREQMIPIDVQWGISNELTGAQLLAPNNNSSRQMLSKMVHNILESSNFAFGIEVAYDDKLELMNYFMELTYTPTNDISFKVEMKKKKLQLNGGLEPTWVYDDRIGFEYQMLLTGAPFTADYGDIVTLTLGFAPEFPKNEID